MDGDAIVRAENARGIPNDGGAKMPESTELTNDGDTEAEVEEALPVTGNVYGWIVLTASTYAMT